MINGVATAELLGVSSNPGQFKLCLAQVPSVVDPEEFIARVNPRGVSTGRIGARKVRHWF